MARKSLDEFSDAELGALVRDRFEKLAEAHEAGFGDTHPADAWNRDSKVLRDHRLSRDGMPGNVASSKEIELTDHPRAQDDPPPTPGTPRPERPGGSLAAQDAALRAAIPGIDRLGLGHGRDFRRVDEDGIVQSPKRGW